MVTHVIGTEPSRSPVFSQSKSRRGVRGSTAARLGPAERKDLSLQALSAKRPSGARGEPIARLADRHGVSRKFVYAQAAKASAALDEAFAPAAGEGPDVLFHLPVTQDWLHQFVLAQVLIGRSSFRGVMEILEAVFDYRGASIGTVHNVVREAVGKARALNDAQDLSRIRVGAHDEIYQAGKPVLVGADVESTFCYLLSVEAHCDETTWGVRLLELAEQGLCPEYTLADGGRALRAGQAAAWSKVPCHGDVFHAECDLGKVAFYLEHRAAGCATARQKVDRRMDRAKRRGKGHCFSKKLAWARAAEAHAITLAQDVRTLADWMKNDVLSLAGPDAATRRRLFDFIVEELHRREARCPHRIRPVRRMLQNHRDDLLAFAGLLDDRFADLARQHHVPLYLVHGVCELQGLDPNQAAYWERETRLRGKLRHRFHDVQAAVRQAMAETPRASSIVENLNSRLRNYFSLRRHIGDDYLDLLRFFLNHRRFLRSDRPERIGKSPAELLNGKTHSHWLELLGFHRFRRN